jgi:hypothetical protein
MPIKPNGLLGRIFHKGALARWQDAAEAADRTPLPDLRAQRYQARQLRAALRALCDTADDRLTPPFIGSRRFARPVGTDWHWRPDPWRLRMDRPGIAPVADKAQFGNDISLFHDCSQQEISLRQFRNLDETDIAPFGLRLEVFHFTGSYLSMVVDLPAAAWVNLQKTHVIRLATQIDIDRAGGVDLRLNVRNGPNVEQILLPLSDTAPERVVEFDLSETGLNPRRADKIWIDLMFHDPAMNCFTLRDLTLCRYPRAAF